MVESGLTLKGVAFTQGDFSLEATLEIPRGSFGCILGPSGCGKTTLLRLVGGFYAPEKGRILLNGRDIGILPPHRRGLGIVFQDYALFPHMSVRENILYGLAPRNPRLSRGWKQKAFPRTEELLALVRLEGYGDRKIGELSGGEQQRVALARALAPGPDLLLLDEPLSALDVQLRNTLRMEIKRIQETLNLTTLYITHDQEEALALADRICVMNAGRIVQEGNPETLYSSPETLFAGTFLGTSSTLEGRIFPGDSRGYGRFAAGGLSLSGRPAGIPSGPDKEKQGRPVSEGGIPGFCFFRPEDCRMEDSAGGADGREENRLEGRVLGTEFRGSWTLVHLEIAGQPVKLIAPRDFRPPRGKGLSFTIPPDRCLLFPA